MLKKYQKKALETLDNFCQKSLSTNPTQAFREMTSNQYLEVDGFANPYVCLRVPTGGGKTLIATKSLRILTNEYLNKDYHLIFWLAPSDKIVTQTLEALKDKRHFYRKLLDKDFDNINVMSVRESYKQKFDPENELVIIIGTIQSFRTNNKDGRKFYDENGNYQELLKSYDMKYSLENVMKHYKPIVILDEAHKSSTGLSLKNLLSLEPSFILEFTATPVNKTSKAKSIYASNILYSVTATELKKESMIKLPILLKTLDDKKAILKDGIEKRMYLEELALMEESYTNRYIRPINLIRADEDRGDNALTYDDIKVILIEEFGIKEDEIAIHTGKLKEIDGIDLLSRACKIKYIITVDALKEGWDCPFAYVLTVVSNMKSSTAIEQLIGRVLRMPYVEEKENKELGFAYVFVVSDNFEKVANDIGQTLIKSGFEKMEAKISINTSSNTNEEVDAVSSLWGDILYEDRQIHLDTINIEDFTSKKLAPYININTQTNNISIISIPTKAKRPKFIKDLKALVPENTHKEIDNIFEKINQENDLLVKVTDIELPKLLINYDDEVLLFEEGIILDYIHLSDKEFIDNSTLTLDEFSINVKEHLVVIDIENEKIKKKEIDRDEASLFVEEEDEEMTKIIQEHSIEIDNPSFTAKLSNSIYKIMVGEHKDLHQVMTSKQIKSFISLSISKLVRREDIDVYLLENKKYQLKRALLVKIKNMISNAKNQSFQKLFDKDNFSMNKENTFTFTSNNYMPNPDNRSANFKKHKYKNVHKFDSQEEYEVALYIDKIPNVKTWIRNIDSDVINSFWLQTAEGKFYPDFILEFENGKTVVAEYKGKVYIPEYEITKKPIAEAWGMLRDSYDFVSLYATNYMTNLSKI